MEKEQETLTKVDIEDYLELHHLVKNVAEEIWNIFYKYGKFLLLFDNYSSMRNFIINNDCFSIGYVNDLNELDKQYIHIPLEEIYNNTYKNYVFNLIKDHLNKNIDLLDAEIKEKTKLKDNYLSHIQEIENI